MRSQNLPHHAALIAFALLVIAPVHVAGAADAAPKKAAGTTATTPPKGKAGLMTRDELRACMDEQDKLKELRAQVLKEDAALNAQQAEIQKLDAEHAQKRATIDPADAPAKEAFLAEVAKRDQIADAYNARARTLIEQSKSLEERRTAWLKTCQRDFDEYDEAVIRKERQRAAGAAPK